MRSSSPPRAGRLKQRTQRHGEIVGRVVPRDPAGQHAAVKLPVMGSDEHDFEARRPPPREFAQYEGMRVSPAHEQQSLHSGTSRMSPK